jgi:membrane-associated phospholipid phosphatase
VTAFSRLTVGAHYLTDVTIAGLVTMLAYVIVSSAARGYAKRQGRGDHPGRDNESNPGAKGIG